MDDDEQGQVTEQLNAAALEAVAVLRAGLRDKSATTRIRAAVAVLNLGKLADEVEEIEERLTQLERQRS